MRKIPKLYPIRYVDTVNKKGKPVIAHSHPQIILFNDNKKYLVKFKNNPQGNRMLMREFIVTMLAKHLDLPTVPFEIAYIPEEFILINELDKYKFKHGNQFASLYLENCRGLWCNPEKNQMKNRDILAGITVFDFWLRNIDRDESNILLRPIGKSDYFIYIIDHGNCYPSKRELLKLIADPSKLELSVVHKWCLSMLNDEIELTDFLRKIMNVQESLIWDFIYSIPGDWQISDIAKKEFYTDIVEAKQVLPDIVEIISRYVQS
ncbi:hypothetical protein QUF99_09340 [Bacillus sp. DX4.1]|uniref:HipA family kinase n=1 Tax=Bacillus sp. DX4.1 TaxID=3055867 RepID=UPI0025A07266|nr:HipA family kinase [Bacillus sp. DX4.1]MDM5187518.1 hypothetical protein [Bacillus sp. DX4.1]